MVRKTRKRANKQTGGFAVPAGIIGQFVAGASRLVPVAVALGYKMFRNSRRTATRKIRR